eukprot:3200199-Pyramimonas_sp.AAC.1
MAEAKKGGSAHNTLPLSDLALTHSHLALMDTFLSFSGAKVRSHSRGGETPLGFLEPFVDPLPGGKASPGNLSA